MIHPKHVTSEDVLKRLKECNRTPFDDIAEDNPYGNYYYRTYGCAYEPFCVDQYGVFHKGQCYDYDIYLGDGQSGKKGSDLDHVICEDVGWFHMMSPGNYGFYAKEWRMMWEYLPSIYATEHPNPEATIIRSKKQLDEWYEAWRKNNTVHWDWEDNRWVDHDEEAIRSLPYVDREAILDSCETLENPDFRHWIDRAAERCNQFIDMIAIAKLEKELNGDKELSNGLWQQIASVIKRCVRRII